MRDELMLGTRSTAFRETVRSLAPNELAASLGQQVLEACAAPMIIFERHGSDCLVRYVNPAFAIRTGYSTAEIARIGWDALHTDGGRERGVARLCAAISERRELAMPLRIYGKDGVTFSASLHVSPLPDAGGRCRSSYAVGVLREGTERAEYVSRLEREALYDPLTGLPNRRVLAERGERAIEQALRENYLVGVALIDLDGFKRINDTLGHAAGDELLCMVGARLARDSRAADLVVRLGGDEFVLLVQDANGDLSVASIVERVRRRIEQPIDLHGQSVSVACSIGVAIFPADGEDLGTLLKYADRAMYRHKARYRSRQIPERFFHPVAASTASPV